MKPIIDIVQSINSEDFFINQFDDNTAGKNFLFVNPQLSGKHLYKMLLPYFGLNKKGELNTAITHISKYDPEGQLLGGKEVSIHPQMIEWADYVIFPFTTQPLFTEIYTNIRKMNPNAIICYQIDFNFYELYNEHPYKKIFDEPTVLSAVEDNLLFSDVIIVSNQELYKYLIDKLKNVIDEKYQNDLDNIKCGIICVPYFIDTEIVLKNTDYKGQDLYNVVAEKQQEVSVDIKNNTEEVKKEELSTDTKKEETKHNPAVTEKINKASAKALEIKKNNPKKSKKTIKNGQFSKSKPKSGSKSKPESSSKSKPARPRIKKK